jgi:hypothetical protein
MNYSERMWAAWDQIQQGWSATAKVLPKIANDPRSYPRESMLIAAAAALVLLLLVLFVFVLMDGVRAASARRRLGLNPLRARRMHLMRTALLILLILAPVLALAPYTATGSKPCGTCHGIAPWVERWEAGAHSSVGCWDCHSSGGVLGALEASSRGIARPLARAAAARPGGIASSRCLRCHEDVAERVVKKGRLLVSHREMIDAGMSCLLCHSTTAHGEGAVRPVVSGTRIEVQLKSRMSRCLVCHDGQQAPSECKTCHAEGPLDKAAASSADPRTPLAPKCRGCHKPSTDRKCIDCHGLELPHPAEFFRQHAGMSHNNPVLCAKCHEMANSQESCGCHNDTNVHGTYSQWFPQHGPAATATNGGAGCQCHEPSFCGQCHDTQVMAPTGGL